MTSGNHFKGDNNEKKGLWIVPAFLFILTSTVFAAAKTWESQQGEFSGTMLTVLITDPHSAVVESWKPEWEALTGAKVKMVVVPYASLYDKVMSGFITQTGAYDLIHWSSTCAGDVMGSEWVIPLDEFIKEYGYPDWDDVAPAIKNVVSWANKVYALPYDGEPYALLSKRRPGKPRLPGEI